ncbi:hypothetical protein Tco_0320218 [Tanacetum coccineum]
MALRSQSQAPPSPIYIPVCSGAVYPSSVPVDDERDVREDPERNPADDPGRQRKGYEELSDDMMMARDALTISDHETRCLEIVHRVVEGRVVLHLVLGIRGRGEVRAGLARQVGPTTAGPDLYGFGYQIFSADDDHGMTELYLEPESTMWSGDRPFHRPALPLLMRARPGYHVPLGPQSIGCFCDQVHSRAYTSDYGQAQQFPAIVSEIVEFCWQQTVRNRRDQKLRKKQLSETRQLVEHERIVKSLKTPDDSSFIQK